MTVHAVTKRWRASELGEAAYLAFHRNLAYRAKRSLAAGKRVPPPPAEAPEWDSLTSRERSAWSAAGREIARLLDFGGESIPEGEDPTEINALAMLTGSEVKP